MHLFDRTTNQIAQPGLFFWPVNCDACVCDQGLEPLGTLQCGVATVIPAPYSVLPFFVSHSSSRKRDIVPKEASWTRVFCLFQYCISYILTTCISVAMFHQALSSWKVLSLQTTKSHPQPVERKISSASILVRPSVRIYKLSFRLSATQTHHHFET